MPTNRSAIALARGARTGVWMMRMSVAVKTASNAAVNLASRSSACADRRIIRPLARSVLVSGGLLGQPGRHNPRSASLPLSALGRSGHGGAPLEVLDHSTIDTTHPYLPAHTVSTGTARERRFRGPGQHAGALGQSAGSPHPRGAAILPVDPAPVSADQHVHRRVGIIRRSAYADLCRARHESAYLTSDGVRSTVWACSVPSSGSAPGGLFASGYKGHDNVNTYICA